MTRGTSLTAVAVAAALAALTAPKPAHAQLQARVSGLATANFGTIATFTNQTNNQNVCVHSAFNIFGFLIRRNYSVLATGNGAGGAFTIASGPRTLPYQVQWADTPSQTTGTQLTAGVTATGFGNASTTTNCTGGETASLIITITGASLTTATAGTYTGTLTILITPN